LRGKDRGPFALLPPPLPGAGMQTTIKNPKALFGCWVGFGGEHVPPKVKGAMDLSGAGSLPDVAML